MAKFKVKPTGKTYAILMCLDEMNYVAVETIVKYVKEGMHSVTKYFLTVYRDMKEAGIAPDHAFYFQYIRLAIKNNRDDRVPEILTEMGKSGLVFDRFISTLLFSMSSNKFAPQPLY